MRVPILIDWPSLGPPPNDRRMRAGPESATKGRSSDQKGAKGLRGKTLTCYLAAHGNRFPTTNGAAPRRA